MFSTLFLVCFPLSPVPLNFKAHSASEYDRTSHSPLKASANDRICSSNQTESEYVYTDNAKRKAPINGFTSIACRKKFALSRTSNSFESSLVRLFKFVSTKNVRDINWYGKRSIFLFLEI